MIKNMVKILRIIGTLVFWVAIALIGVIVYFYYGYLLEIIRPLSVEQLPVYIDVIPRNKISTSEITLESVKTMQELTTFKPIRAGTPVIRISEDPARRYYLVVYEGGAFRKWNIDTGKVETEYDFQYADDWTYFNENGSLLITLGGFVWDTQTGTMIDCERMGSENCPSPASVADYGEVMVLDPVRRVKIKVTGVGYTVGWYSVDETFTDSLGLQNGGLGCWDYVGDYGEGTPEWMSPGMYEFNIDPSGKYIACVIDGGVIIVLDWSLVFDRYIGEYGNNVSREYPYIHLLRYSLPDQQATVREMKFDATRTWLAALTDRDLVAWDLRRWIFARKLHVSVADGKVVEFDRRGNLLAVGTSDGIIIFNVTTGKLAAEYDLDAVTDLYFTRDNRLLLWGDEMGVVHVWGIK